MSTLLVMPSAAELRPLLSASVSRGASSAPLSLHRLADLPPAWVFRELVGRLLELGGGPAPSSGAAAPSATATAAAALVADAQQHGEQTAWIATRDGFAYPPDLAEWGIDLASLAVVRLRGTDAFAQAADWLLRSGAFGVVVLDFGAAAPELPMPVQVRLAGLAQKHAAVALCLGQRPILRSSLASLRAVSTRERTAEGRFRWTLDVTKDKRRGHPWRTAQVLRGPVGLC